VDHESEPAAIAEAEEVGEPDPVPVVEAVVQSEPEPVSDEAELAAVAVVTAGVVHHEPEPAANAEPELIVEQEPEPATDEAEPAVVEPAFDHESAPSAVLERESEPEPASALEPEPASALQPEPASALQPEPAPTDPDPDAVRWTRRPASTPRERVPDEVVAEPVGADEVAGAAAAAPSHPVTVSWRGEDAMANLELDGPRAVDPDDLIIVEPPSQLVAPPRRRRPPAPPAESDTVEVTPDAPQVTPTPVVPPTREPAPSPPADGPPARIGRGVVLLVVLLAILAALVWFFLLRDSDPASALSTARAGVALVAPELNGATGRGDLPG
jgi:hypothetical protein